MDTAVANLIALGLKPDQIVMERFDYDSAHDVISTALRWKFVALLAAVFIGVGGLAWWVYHGDIRTAFGRDHTGIERIEPGGGGFGNGWRSGKWRWSWRRQPFRRRAFED